MSHEEGGTGIQDSRWRNFRQCLPPLMILAAFEKVGGNEEAYVRIILQLRIMQRQIRKHLGKLLRGGGLRFVGRENVWLFGSPLGEPFIEKMMKKGTRWTIRLIDGKSDPQLDTILAAKEEDSPLFAGLSLRFQVEGESNWVAYQPFGGDLKTDSARRLVPPTPLRQCEVFRQAAVLTSAGPPDYLIHLNSMSLYFEASALHTEVGR